MDSVIGEWLCAGKFNLGRSLKERDLFRTFAPSVAWLSSFGGILISVEVTAPASNPSVSVYPNGLLFTRLVDIEYVLKHIQVWLVSVFHRPSGSKVIFG